MAGRRVERQRAGAREDEEGAETDTEPSVEVEGVPDVLPQEDEPEEGQVEREPMHVLEDEREPGLAHVGALDLAHRAGGRIPEEGPVVRLPVVIAGGPEQKRRDEDEEGRRDRPPTGVDLRRIDWGEVAPESKVRVLRGGPHQIEAGESKAGRDGAGREPPRVAPVGRPQPLPRHRFGRLTQRDPFGGHSDRAWDTNSG